MENFTVSAAIRGSHLVAAVLLASAGIAQAGPRPSVDAKEAQPRKLVGRLDEVPRSDLPRPVRNDVAQTGKEIVTLRYFRIKKGKFPEFYRASRDDIWPYFEKLGVRVIGMWKVFQPPDVPGAGPAGTDAYDVVYLSARYASVAHWKASRETVKHGGNGPDWEKCRAALALRRKLTLETYVQFLQGGMAPNGPYFMPGLDEQYEARPGGKP